MLNPALNIIGGRITLKKTSGSNVACNICTQYTITHALSMQKAPKPTVTMYLTDKKHLISTDDKKSRYNRYSFIQDF